eukprot:Sspe_Gene.16658::Locus_5878_Transcript_1_1_Confidence_1.000_Length_1685::g.16658::m.16658
MSLIISRRPSTNRRQRIHGCRVAVPSPLPRLSPSRTVAVFLKTITGKYFVLPGGVPVLASFDAIRSMARKAYRIGDFAVAAFGKAVGMHRTVGDVLPSQAMRYVVLNIAWRLRGGKGGFGSNLRARGKNASQRTTNFDACRSVTGVRIRHLRQEKALQKWARGEENADDETMQEFGAVMTPSELKRRQRERKRRQDQLEADDKRRQHQEKVAIRERIIDEGYQKIVEKVQETHQNTVAAVASGLKIQAKKRSGCEAVCPEGHSLEEMHPGKDKTKGGTGYDYNICDECDEEIDRVVHRCSECDYDICPSCRDKGKEAVGAEPATKQATKKKKKSAGMLCHDLDTSSEEAH